MSTGVATPARRALDSLLFSYAQILFSNRRWLGAVLLAATCFHPASGLFALGGVALSNLIAWLLKFDAARIESGFYGFNGVLLGAAYGYFFAPNPFLIALFPLFVVMAFFVAAALEHWFAAAFNLPGLSLPFMLSLYLTLIFLGNYSFVQIQPAVAATPSGWPPLIAGYLHTLGFILFQGHVWAGALIALGLLLFSRVLFVLTLAGFFTNSLLVHLLLPEQAPQLLILTGLNAVLVAIALGGSLVIPSRKSLVLALLAVMMTVIFTGVFVRLLAASHLPVMVLPFNIIVLGTLYSLKFRQSASGLVLLYFSPGSPEENHYYHHTTQARFDKLRYRLCDLPFAGEWTVSQGHGGTTTHQGDWRHAWDFVVEGEDGRTYENQGTKLEDYLCYRLPVRAPDDGVVALVVDNVRNNPIGDVNLARNWGNTIILKHAEGLYSSLSHLEPGSAKVTVGQAVTRGEVLALCGSSGRSPEPHLHFQFQATARLGDVTLPYPLGVFARRQGAECALCTSEIPPEGARVQNLKPHRELQEALTLALGDTLRFACHHGEDHDAALETWQVKVDVYNALYIESSAGAWVSVLKTDSVVYLTGFRGRRRSALYHFYLAAAQLPLGYQPGMTWADRLPLDKVLRSWVRPLSEFFLLFGTPLRADVRFHLDTDTAHGGSPVIASHLRITGKGPFRPVRHESRGRLRLGSEGGIAALDYDRNGRTVFRARRLNADESAVTSASPLLEETPA